MDEQNIKKSGAGIGGLAVVYLVLAVVGSLLSAVYIFANYFSPLIYLSVLYAVIFAGVLYAVTKWLIGMMRITNRKGAVIAVALAILTFSYVKWSVFFGLNYLNFSYFYSEGSIDLVNDPQSVIVYIVACLKYPFSFINSLLYFNANGTWYYDNAANVVSGVLLWIIWIVEFVVLAYAPLAAAYKGYGLLIKNADGVKVAAEPYFDETPFEQFDEYDYDKIKAGEFGAIVEKNKALNGRKSYNVAFFKVDGEYTGVIAIYRCVVFNGKTRRTPASKHITIGEENAVKFAKALGSYDVPVDCFDAEVKDGLINDIESFIDGAGEGVGEGLDNGVENEKGEKEEKEEIDDLAEFFEDDDTESKN